MDDFLILTRTRWQLRRGIAHLQVFFDCGGFERHLDKTQTGRVHKEFDWLGLWFGHDGLAIAPRALNNYRERCLRLYKQSRLRGFSVSEASARVQAY